MLKVKEEITRNTKKKFFTPLDGSEYKRLRSVTQHIAFGTTGGTTNRSVAYKTGQQAVKSLVASYALRRVYLYPWATLSL